MDIGSCPQARVSLSKAASAAPQATGGPDDYGYTWDDSVALSWIDATSGTDTGMSGYGGQAVGVSLPFPFKYYENTFNSVYIVGAGYLSFSSGDFRRPGRHPLTRKPQQCDRALLDPDLSE